jgi:hypothetical protein
VTAGFQVTAGAPTIPTSGVPVTVLTGTYTASGNQVLLLVAGDFIGSSTNIDFSVVLDPAGANTTIFSGNCAHGFKLRSQALSGAPLFVSLSAGSHTFQFNCNSNDGLGASVQNNSLIVQDWQR